MSTEPLVLGGRDTDIPFPGWLRRCFKNAGDNVIIGATAHVLALEGKFPPEVNPQALIYPDDEGYALLVYFDAAVQGAKEAALAEMPKPSTPHYFTEPLYVR